MEEEGDGKTPSAKEWGIKAVTALMDTEPTHNLLDELLPDNNYFRLNPSLASLPDIDQVGSNSSTVRRERPFPFSLRWTQRRWIDWWRAPGTT